MQPPSDRGAHFHKCDLQVHTPRDNQWNGQGAVSDDERRAYASELITACRSKGIDAVAVTDHHDLAFFTHVKAAAQNEMDGSGQPVPEAKRVVVYPGIELSLTAPPCQALLLLDPNFPEESFPTVLTALAITITPTANAQLGPVVKITQAAVEDLSDLYKKLNLHGAIRGRFIVLPNVSEGGHHTLLRAGCGNFYSTMPCVGGYLDGPVSQHGAGNNGIVEGKNAQYGSKAIALFQTSDNRRRDHGDLGTHVTWVKWSEPSAEALRQACLARKSRISQTEPIYPKFQIVGVNVSNSVFLGPVSLGLNPQFNAFIGGRGTGKSSLLEYIRWALCDDPLPSTQDQELPNYQQRRKVLIEHTLKPAAATVSVFYKKNEVLYRIERSVATTGETLTVYDQSGNGQAMSQAQIRAEFPIVSYAQKQLSSVGTLPDEVNRLITAPVQDQVAEIQKKIENDILPKLRAQRAKELRLSLLKTSIAENESSLQSKREQVRALQGKLNTLTPAQQAVIGAHDGIVKKHQWVLALTGKPIAIADTLKRARTQVDVAGAISSPGTDAPSNTLVLEVTAFAKAASENLSGSIEKAESGQWMTPETKAWVDGENTSYLAHMAEYELCLTASAKNKEQLAEIQSLNKIIADLEQKLSVNKLEKETLDATLAEGKETHWAEFKAAIAERAQLLRNQCDTINQQAQHEFIAELKACNNPEPLIRAMNQIVQGKNVRDSDAKVTELAKLVVESTDPIDKWSEVVAELDLLFAAKGTETDPETPILIAATFTQINKAAMKNSITQEMIDQVRYLNLDDRIRFSFHLGSNPDNTPKYIPFNAASPGQQATCLLRTLLAQTGAPLLIDQPEEDLDNEQIQVLSESIAQTKHNRQLLFVSHNANIVVNGDAELVVAFGYRETNDNSHGEIALQGSIDSQGMRDRITAVMEGGREAFTLRKSKYGF